MYSRETRVLLRHYLEQGVSKSELAKRFGISRRTVYHWIETGQLERDLDRQEVHYRARPPVPTQLDPYKPIIQERLEAFPLLTVRVASRNFVTGCLMSDVTEGLVARSFPSCFEARSRGQV